MWFLEDFFLYLDDYFDFNIVKSIRVLHNLTSYQFFVLRFEIRQLYVSLYPLLPVHVISKHTKLHHKYASHSSQNKKHPQLRSKNAL